MTASKFANWLLKRIEEYFKRPIASWIIKSLITGGIGILSSPWWVPILEWLVQKTLNVPIANSEVWGFALITIGLLMYVIKFEIDSPRVSFSIDIDKVVCTHEKIARTNSKTGVVLEKDNTQNESPYESFWLYINIHNDSLTNIIELKSFASLKVKPDADSNFSGIVFTEEEYKKSPLDGITIKSKEFIKFDVVSFIFMVPSLFPYIQLHGSPILFGKTFIVTLRSEYYSVLWFYKFVKKKFHSDKFELRFKITDTGSTPSQLKMGFEYLGEKSISYNSSSKSFNN